MWIENMNGNIYLPFENWQSCSSLGRRQFSALSHLRIKRFLSSFFQALVFLSIHQKCNNWARETLALCTAATRKHQPLSSRVLTRGDCCWKKCVFHDSSASFCEKFGDRPQSRFLATSHFCRQNQVYIFCVKRKVPGFRSGKESRSHEVVSYVRFNQARAQRRDRLRPVKSIKRSG